MAVYKSNDKTKDGRCWYYTCYKKDFEGNNIKYKSKRYLTKKEAEEEESKFILSKELKNKNKFKNVVNNYIDYLYKNRKDSTALTYEDSYKLHIEPYFGNLNIEEINVLHINNWKNKLIEKGLQVSSMNKIHTILSNIFNYAIKNYNLMENPARMSGRFESKREEIIDKEEKMKYMTYDEFTEFIKVIDNEFWKTLFIFLYYTGVRKGEMQALTWKNVFFDKKEIYIKENLTVKTKDKKGYKITSTKNLKNRKIKMSKFLVETMIKYKKSQQEYADFNENWFVFGGPRFTPQTNIDNNKDKYFKISGVNRITIKEFRHSHVSLLINEYLKSGQTDAGKFFIMMSARMGHTIEVMQKTYMHLFPTIQDEIIDILDNL